jgi:hypothetical protein
MHSGSQETRLAAAEAFARSLRTAEKSAGEALRPRLAQGIVYSINGTETQGVDKVVDRLTRVFPFTPVMARGVWGYAASNEAGARIEASFDALGAAPRNYTLDFRFDDQDRIARVDEKYEFGGKPTAQKRIPAPIRSAIDRALANNTPMVLAYVDDAGAPSLSLRGSIQVWGDNELCAWLRDAKSGLVRAVEAGRPLSLLYRDSATRTTLVIKGRGRIAADAETRERIYLLTPEVEQTHDVERRGAALVIAIDRIAGTHPSGPVLVEP